MKPLNDWIGHRQSFVHAQKTGCDRMGQATALKPCSDLSETFHRPLKPLCDRQFFWSPRGCIAVALSVWLGFKKPRSHKLPYINLTFDVSRSNITFLAYISNNLEIETRDVLRTDRKSHMGFLFMPWPLTLDDFERSNLLRYTIKRSISSIEAHFNQKSL